MKLLKKLLIPVITSLLCCTSLPQEPDNNNKYDKNSPDYISPKVTITSAPGDTIFIDQAAFSWQGNGTGYRHQLLGSSSKWSSWQDTLTSVFKYLDEGNYIFKVQTTYPNGDIACDSTGFTVNAVIGPSLILCPKYTEVKNGDTIRLAIIGEEMVDLVAAKITLNVDNTDLSILSVTEGPFFNLTGGQTVFFTSTSETSIRIETGTSLGSPMGITGSDTIAYISLIASGTDNLSFDAPGCLLRNSGQSAVIPANLLSGAIVINE